MGKLGLDMLAYAGGQIARRVAARAAPGLIKYGARALRVAQAYQGASRAYQHMRNRGNNNTRDPPGVTSQHDVRTIYRRKRMPYRKKRRWIRLKKRVNAVINNALGTRSVIRNGTQTSSVSDASGNQSYLEATLYGISGSGLHNDVKEIFDSFGTADQLRGKLLRFKSAVLDITLTNTSSSGQTTEIDIYSYYVKKSFPEADVGTLLDGVLADAVTPVISTLSTFTKETRGFTPFQAPAALKYIKILKKTKYFLGSGQSITYQHRDSRDRTFNGEYVGDSQPFRAGWTKGLIIITKSTAGGTGNHQTTMGITKTYSFVQLDKNDAQKGLV